MNRAQRGFLANTILMLALFALGRSAYGQVTLATAGRIKTIAGTGVAVVPSAMSLNFGSVSRGGTKTLPLTFTNQGVPEAVTVASASGSTSFKVTSNGCTTGITTGNNCAIQIEFAPTSSGNKTATIKFTPSSGPSYDITLEGTLTP